MIFWLLLIAHCVTDFPLQGDFLAKAKNHRAPIMGVPWFPCLLAHVVISGGGVTLVTGSLVLGVLEAAAHLAIDYCKNDGDYGFVTDQVLHVACKVIWAWAAPMALLMEATR